MKYEIDVETADGITKGVLKETIKFLKKSIKKNKEDIKLRGSKAPATWLEDLACDERYLEACKTVYEFFGGNLK
jgi:serine protease inhibitor